jgi:xanthine dehydrogenase YagR molybdenum-binding subunit
MDNYGTAGIGAGAASEGGGGGADIPAPYLYKVANTRVKQTAVVVNAGSARAFRAPGNPPASFGMESAMDDLAAKLGMDPMELRLKNDPSPIRQREYVLGAERFGWKQKYRKPGSSPGVVKSGVGCAGAAWPAGGASHQTQGEAQINPDGSIEFRLGVQDIGTGTKTVIAVVAAELLGLKPEQITVKVGDTHFPPGPGSGGSTTCASISPTVYDVCTKALQQMRTQSGLADVRGKNWFAACKKLGVNPLVVHGQWQPGLSSDHACGVQFAEVAVDTETGLVTVTKVVAIARRLGLGPVQSWTVEEATCEWGEGHSRYSFGSNRRVRARRARIELGWSPKHASLMDWIEHEMPITPDALPTRASTESIPA